MIQTYLATPPLDRRCSAHPVRRAFSLIELMVVVGIIAVLISLILPATQQLRRQGKMTTCASQLHQIHVASQLWKQAHPGMPLPANGWRVEYARLIEDAKIYNCPESKEVIDGAETERTGDRAAKESSTTTGGGGSSGGSTTSGGSGSAASTAAEKGISLADCYVHVQGSGGDSDYTWDVPLVEGPWVKKENVTPNSYELWIEDWGGRTGGDKDFKDIMVKVTDLGNGNVKMELAKRPDGKSSGHRSDIMAVNPDGGAPTPIFDDLYKGGDQAGATDTLNGPFDLGSAAIDPSTGKAYNGSLGGAPVVTPGQAGVGTKSDYGVNANVQKIDGLGEKVFGMDYTWSTIDPEVHDWGKTPWIVAAPPAGREGVPTFARHVGGRANVLWGDGSVRSDRVSTITLNPQAGTSVNAARYWRQ